MPVLDAIILCKAHGFPWTRVLFVVAADSNRKGDAVIVSGDTLFKGSVGRTDLWGGDFEQLNKSIKKRIYTLDTQINVLPGHGQLTRIYDEKKYNPFVRD